MSRYASPGRMALLLALVATATVAGTVAAQSANITASATVFQPITINGARNLAFGNVFPGVNSTVAIAAPTSGRFDIVAQASQPLTLTFTLPLNLASGANNLLINTWTGCWNGTNTVTGCTVFTPSGSATTATIGAASTLFVFVGATVAPTAAQVAGTYTGTVTLTVAY